MLKKQLSSEKINDLLFFIFLFTIFLFRIPNLYILPFIKNPLFTSQAIARILIIINFLLNISLYFKKNTLFFNKNKILINLILVLFIIQSLSIFSILNTESFLLRYKDIVISLIFFINVGLYKNKTKQIILVLLFGFFINAVYQFILLFRTDFFTRVVSEFIYQKHLNYVLANLDRNRIYIDSFDEIIIPFLFLNLFVGKPFYNVLAKIGIFLIIIFSFLSNFRTRILMAIFAIIVSFGFLIKYKKSEKIFLIFLILLIVFFFLNTITLGEKKFFRFNNPEEFLETSSIITRVDQIKLSFYMGGASLFGVGLGNYFDNLPSFFKNKDLIISQSVNFVKLGAEEYVHNIFGFIVAESGYIGLFIFVCIIYLFIKKDFFTQQKNDYLTALVISFWTLFIYGLFNPIIPASYQVLFWLIRGLLM